MSYRVGILGATGAVGSTLLEVLAERDFPVSELVPLASARSAGKRVRFAGDEVEVRVLDRRVDPGPRPRALLGGRSGQLRVGPADHRSRRGRRRQHLLLPHARGRPAGDPRGEPRRGGRAPGPRREPELHDDADGRRPGADPPGGGDRAAGGLDLPVGFGHRAQRDRGAQGAVARGPRRRRADRRGLPPPGRLQRRSRRSRPSRTATTTPPRSARSWPRRARSWASPRTSFGSRPPASGSPLSPAIRSP